MLLSGISLTTHCEFSLNTLEILSFLSIIEIPIPIPGIFTFFFAEHI